MIIKPMLASDFSPLLPYVIAFFILLDIFGFACLVINAKAGRNTWWGLVLGLICMLGGFVSLGSVWNAIPEYYFMKLPASLPLVCGLLSLYLWGMGRKNWHGLLLRILLYGSIIIGGLVLFALWVRPY